MKTLLSQATHSLMISSERKKVAIIAVKNSSIDLLFRNRSMDHFPLNYDPLVTAKALELIEKDERDVIKSTPGLG